jgi:hypothetical protein
MTRQNTELANIALNTPDILYWLDEDEQEVLWYLTRGLKNLPARLEPIAQDTLARIELITLDLGLL